MSLDFGRTTGRFIPEDRIDNGRLLLPTEGGKVYFSI
jgi:hypothetical protein